MLKTRREKRQRRKLHVRKNLSGTKDIPRINVFRSNRFIYVQAVDDEAGKSMWGMGSMKIKSAKADKPVEVAAKLGEEFSTILKKNKIERAVFDRSGYKYHGRVKALADGIRKGGINL
ncbi:MAG: 50S ribosomal protein L18 [bacterium]